MFKKAVRPLPKVKVANDSSPVASDIALMRGYLKIKSAAQRFRMIGNIVEANNYIPARALERFLVHVLSKDEDPVIRHEAAFVLGKLKERGTIGGCLASRALCRVACEDRSMIVRHEALEALCWFKGRTVGAVLQQFLGDENCDIRATAAISFTAWKSHRSD